MYNKNDWPLTLYFDGQCPLFAREIKMLNRHAAKLPVPDRDPVQGSQGAVQRYWAVQR